MGASELQVLLICQPLALFSLLSLLQGSQQVKQNKLRRSVASRKSPLRGPHDYLYTLLYCDSTNLPIRLRLLLHVPYSYRTVASNNGAATYYLARNFCSNVPLHRRFACVRLP
ncbi:hypothetical protein V8C40DRAFT_237187 [Trichoderma camerunense]